MRFPFARCVFVLACLVAFVASPLAVSTARAMGQQEPTTGVESAELPDGAHLIVLPDTTASQVVIEVMFRVGENDEGSLHGVNSLLTRAWASGSDNRSGELLRGDIGRHGEAIGTLAQPDYVELWSVCDKDELERTAQTVFTNIISVPLFEHSAVESARTEQLNAMSLRSDDILTDVMDSLRSRAYGEVAYGVPVIGSDATIRSLRADSVAPYYQKFFRPERAVIVIAGPVTMDDVKHLIVGCIGAGGWDEVGPHSPAVRFETAPPIPVGLHDGIVPRRAPATYVAAGYLAPGVDSHVTDGSRQGLNYAAMLLVDAVLGGGKSGRLFALRDRPTGTDAPIGYEIHTVFAPTRAQSFWAAYVVGNQPPIEVRDRLLTSLRALGNGTEPITEAELTRAKDYLKARHLEERQTLRDRAIGLAWAETMGIGTDFEHDYDLIIETVTVETVNHMARRVLGGNPAVVRSLPLPKAP